MIFKAGSITFPILQIVFYPYDLGGLSHQNSENRSWVSLAAAALCHTCGVCVCVCVVEELGETLRALTLSLEHTLLSFPGFSPWMGPFQPFAAARSLLTQNSPLIWPKVSPQGPSDQLPGSLLSADTFGFFPNPPAVKEGHSHLIKETLTFLATFAKFMIRSVGWMTCGSSGHVVARCFSSIMRLKKSQDTLKPQD